MQTVTWSEWCQIKKQRDRDIEQQADKLTMKKCSCGQLYSFDDSYQQDPHRCSYCRNGEMDE